MELIPGNISGQIILNEVCAANQNMIADFEGEFNDWIEITNTGAVPVNLEGYCLRDDKQTDLSWCFPSYILNPGEYLVLFTSGKNITTPPSNWKTLVREGDEWRYLIPNSNIPDWITTGFDDNNWLTGPSGIGYGDGDDATTIATGASVYMRIRFTIDDASSLEAALLHMDYDDSFIAYINGKEICRSNISGNPPDFNTLATGNHEATMYSGGTPEAFTINNPASVFINGENILALEVHNVSETSSDMTAIPFLSVLSSVQSGSPPPPILELESRLFHTNFKLDADGDSLYLSDPSGTTIDSFIFTMQLPDDSYGRVPGQEMDWWLFDIPTPGSANSSHAFLGYVEDLPRFSKEGGFFANLTYLTLSSDNPGDTIYYTMDGTDPDINATIYNQRIEINAESVVSARILRDNYIPGKVISNTFYNKNHHGLPIITITTDPYNFFDWNYGIYEKGPNAETSFPYFGSNFWNDWERPVIVTMYDADTVAFRVGAGVKIFGGWSRGHDQKSLSIYVRSIYGDRNINYPIFEDRPFKKFEALVLRNSGNDWYGGSNQSGTMMRDVLMTRLTKNMNIERQASRQAVLYINGEYWGIHNIREKVNEHFLASNCDIDPDRIHLLQNNQEVIIGSNAHYANLINFVESNNLEISSNYEYVRKQMDIQNFINYELSQIYFDNTDWPGNNIKYWRPDYENGKWRWIMFDTDFGFGMWDRNKVNHNTLEFALDPNQTGWPNPAWSTLLLRKLVANQDFMELFVNSFADQMNTSFLPDTVNALFNFLKSNIDDEIISHVERWGANYQTWINLTSILKYFGDNRSTAVRSHLISRFNLGTLYSLNLEISEKGAGVIALNTIMVRDFPWSGIYFKNVPVTVTAIPEPGYVFTGWTGTVNSTSPKIEIHLNSATSITANFAPDPNPDPMRVIINEICYNSDSINSTADWIELYNRSDQYVDLSGWMIKDGNNSHIYRIKHGAVVEPNGYYLICRNKYKFSSKNPDLENIEGNLKFGLSSTGDIVRLFNYHDEIVNIVSYGINTPWPIIPDGSGYTLSLLHPSLDNFPASSWRISDEQYGTPGKRNFGEGVEIGPSPEVLEDVLFQNFPNPFSLSTQILICTDRFQHVRLSVFDLNGRLVEVLEDNDLEKGYHEYHWAPASLNPGMYLLRFETPQTVRTLRMMKVL